MKNLSQKIGGLGCLAIAVYLYIHGYQNSLVVILGILGAFEALS